MRRQARLDARGPAERGASGALLWWRLITLVAAASAGAAVFFSGDFDSLAEVSVRLLGSVAIAVTVHVVWAAAGSGRSGSMPADSPHGASDQRASRTQR